MTSPEMTLVALCCLIVQGIDWQYYCLPELYWRKWAELNRNGGGRMSENYRKAIKKIMYCRDWNRRQKILREALKDLLLT